MYILHQGTINLPFNTQKHLKTQKYLRKCPTHVRSDNSSHKFSNKYIQLMIKHYLQQSTKKKLKYQNLFITPHRKKPGNSTNRHKIQKRKEPYKFLRHGDHGTSFTVRCPWDQAKYEPSGAKATVQFSRPHFLSKGAAGAKSSPIVRDLTKRKNKNTGYHT